MKMLRRSIIQLLKVGQIGFNRRRLIFRAPQRLLISCSYVKIFTIIFIYKVDCHEVSGLRLMRPVLKLDSFFSYAIGAAKNTWVNGLQMQPWFLSSCLEPAWHQRPSQLSVMKVSQHHPCSYSRRTTVLIGSTARSSPAPRGQLRLGSVGINSTKPCTIWAHPHHTHLQVSLDVPHVGIVTASRAQSSIYGGSWSKRLQCKAMMSCLGSLANKPARKIKLLWFILAG